jgi:hypothetical protein
VTPVSADKKLTDNDLEKCLIPLVVSVQGVPLRQLKDCIKWVRIVQKLRKLQKGQKSKATVSHSVFGTSESKSEMDKGESEEALLA